MATELADLRQAQAVQEERMNTVRSETQAAVDRLVASIAEDGKRRAEELAAERKAQAAERTAEQKAQAAERAAEQKAQAKRDAQHAKEQVKQAKELNRALWFVAATITGIIGLFLAIGFGSLGLLLHSRQEPVVRPEPIIIYATPPPLTAPAPQPQVPAAPPAAQAPAAPQPQAQAAPPAAQPPLAHRQTAP